MSAWPIPDEVVESFANIMGGSMRDARGFLEAHRLVQLPEEPTEWEVEWEVKWYDDDPWMQEDTYEEACEVATSSSKYATTGRIRPVYRIPGQPITVDKEERDGE